MRFPVFLLICRKKMRSPAKRKRVRDAAEANIVAERLVGHLERCGFINMRKPPIGTAPVIFDK